MISLNCVLFALPNSPNPSKLAKLNVNRLPKIQKELGKAGNQDFFFKEMDGYIAQKELTTPFYPWVMATKEPQVL